MFENVDTADNCNLGEAGSTDDGDKQKDDVVDGALRLGEAAHVICVMPGEPQDSQEKNLVFSHI